MTTRKEYGPEYRKAHDVSEGKSRLMVNVQKNEWEILVWLSETFGMSKTAAMKEAIDLVHAEMLLLKKQLEKGRS